MIAMRLIWISTDFADISILTPNKLTYCDSIGVEIHSSPAGLSTVAMSKIFQTESDDYKETQVLVF